MYDATLKGKERNSYLVAGVLEVHAMARRAAINNGAPMEMLATELFTLEVPSLEAWRSDSSVLVAAARSLPPGSLIMLPLLILDVDFII